MYRLTHFFIAQSMSMMSCHWCQADHRARCGCHGKLSALGCGFLYGRPLKLLFWFIWIQDLMQSKERVHHTCKDWRTSGREGELERSFPVMSNMTRYDEMKKNCGRSKMWSWSVMVPCTIFWNWQTFPVRKSAERIGACCTFHCSHSEHRTHFNGPHGRSWVSWTTNTLLFAPDALSVPWVVPLIVSLQQGQLEYFAVQAPNFFLSLFHFGWRLGFQWRLFARAVLHGACKGALKKKITPPATKKRNSFLWMLV